MKWAENVVAVSATEATVVANVDKTARMVRR